MSSRQSLCSLLALLCMLFASLAVAGAAPLRQPDVPFGVTPYEVVEEMLRLTAVTKEDVVYDLGSGDGRIVIMAAQKFGARGVGVDLDADLVEQSIENARKAGVADRARFVAQDMFETDVSEASVVTLYIMTWMNVRVRPQLFRQLKPGSRIVSHDFDMEDWRPDRTVRVQGPHREHTLYTWVLPASVGGTWRWNMVTPRGERRSVLRLRQKFQDVSGTLAIDGKEAPITDVKLTGDLLSFTAQGKALGQPGTLRFSSRIAGDAMKGSVAVSGAAAQGAQEWVASRDAVDLAGVWRWETEMAGNTVTAALRIKRSEGRWSATYVRNGEETPVTDLYAWGPSIFFTIGADAGARRVYAGSLERERFVGTISQGDHSGKWNARRVKD